MTLGKRIKKIRNFRDMKQIELGEAAQIKGTADVRICQYENDSRVPKASRLKAIADALSCSYSTLASVDITSPEELIAALFWMEEDNPDMIQLLPVTSESDDVPSAVALTFDSKVINQYLNEWHTKKMLLKNKRISEEDYFNWKISYNKLPKRK